MPWGCSCSETIRELANGGFPFAQYVMENHLPESAWTAGQTMMHMDEEERSRLFKRFPNYIKRRLLADHARFRKQLQFYGNVDEQEMREHAAIEEAFTKKVIGR